MKIQWKSNEKSMEIITNLRKIELGGLPGPLGASWGASRGRFGVPFGALRWVARGFNEHWLFGVGISKNFLVYS